MRVLITGASGFIGAVVAAYAADHGHEVWAVDNNSRGLNRVQEHPGVTFREHDCKDGLAPILDDFVPDAVVHLAAGTGSLERPLNQLRALNQGITERVFHDAAASGVRAFVFPTTSLALGVPDSPYVIAKEETMKWLQGHPMSSLLVPLRFFNVIGAYAGFTEWRKHEVHVIPTMLAAHGAGREFVINGIDYDTVDGSPSRDFINVIDVAEFLLKTIETRLTAGEPLVLGPDGALWVGTGQTTTVVQLCQMFQQMIGPLHLNVAARRRFDTGSLVCDRRQAEQVRTVIGHRLRPVWWGILSEVRAIQAYEKTLHRVEAHD